MELALIGVPLIGGALWLKYPVSRESAWNWIAAWAASNRDAAKLRRERRAEYLASEVPDADA